MEAIVGGYPNSGTSFLCHLVSKMGFHPGSDVYLKGADEHNRWGYWEHLILRHHSWGLLGGVFRHEMVKWIPEEPLPRNEEVADAISAVAAADNVGVYKDNAIPLVYRSFPKDAKYIIILRRPMDCFKSPKRAGNSGYWIAYKEYLEAFGKYHMLVDTMRGEVDTLLVQYGEFKDNLEKQVNKVATFLDVTLDNPQEIYDVFRPRG